MSDADDLSTRTRIERTDGWLYRWRVIYPTGGGMDLSTEHITRLGARFAVLMDRA